MYILPELPFAYDALQPHVSALTMQTHHAKHHKAYVDATNALSADRGLAGEALEDLVRQAKTDGEAKLFNQSAQAWNHAFFWRSLSPQQMQPQGALLEAVSATFGSVEEFGAKFIAEGVGHFASGWAWLAADENRDLLILSTHDADTALARPGLTPLLVCDLWEHAYYLDYKNLRKDFLGVFVSRLANWEFAADQYAAALGEGSAFAYPAPVPDAAVA
jgi:Fe-Mn family superoxide dismutase